MSSSTLRVEGQDVSLTNLDKFLWPHSITKAALIRYHLEMGTYTIPYYRRRPLTVVRYPNGISGSHFYQKNCPSSVPNWVDTYPIQGDDKTIDYLLADHLPTMVWLANQAALELHPATYQVEHIAHPSFAIVDLDPTPPQGFAEAARVAGYTKVILEQIGLRGYPKTSGATGLHIYIPLRPIYSFAQTARLVQFIGGLLSEFYPEEVTTERLIKKRRGVYVDYLQNAPSKTIVGAYSPRALPDAPVSTPVLWEELQTLRPEEFTVLTVPRRVTQMGDVFRPVLDDQQSLDPVLPLLEAVPER